MGKYTLGIFQCYVLAWLSVLLISPSVSAQAATQCSALKSADFSGIQDAPAQLRNATPVAATKDLPAYCEVTGSVTQHVDFEMRLPEHGWNDKFLAIPNTSSAECDAYL